MDTGLDLDILWRLLLAVLLGGVIGIEREWFNKSAGLRSMMLICLGAAIFTVCSEFLGAKDDHSRIASNIVVGVGFVGGGVIFKGDAGIKGITTAVTIWVTAGIGMLAGCMRWEVACMATGVVVLVLFALHQLEVLIEKLNSVRTYRMTYPLHLFKAHYVTGLVKHCGLHKHSTHHKRESGMITATWQIEGPEKAHHRFINEVLDNSEVEQFEF